VVARGSFEEGGVDAGVVIAIGLGLSAVGALGLRTWLLRLPLTLGARAVRATLWGTPVVRVRARLGRGRRVERAVVRATWRSPEGREVALEVDDPAVVRVGAWTITLRDPGGVTDAPGVVCVEVEAFDGRRAWAASAVFALSERPRGAFAALGDLRGGRWRWGADPWAVVPDDAPAPRVAGEAA
jgi:hypothetical protein